MSAEIATSVGEELAVRRAQRDALAAFLEEHPQAELSAEDLIAVVGPNYRSRISDCRYELGMDIRNVPRFQKWTERGKPRSKRLIGGYTYVPAASRPSPERWPIPGAPFAEAEGWTLTPPESR